MEEEDRVGIVEFKEPFDRIVELHNEMETIVQTCRAEEKVNDLINSSHQRGSLKTIKPSQLQRWSIDRNHIPAIPPGVKVHLANQELARHPLSTRIEEMTETLESCDVLLIEAPTGSGKSVLTPAMIAHIAKKALADGSLFPMVRSDEGWKAIHTAPIGEQAVQHADYLIENDNGDGTEFGYYTSTVADEDVTERKYAPKNCNYVYATTYFGLQAIEEGRLHAAVIDEVHEFTPDLIKVLHKCRTALTFKMPHRTLYKVVLLSATLSDDTRGDIERFFSIDGIRFKKLNYDDRKFNSKEIVLSDANSDYARQHNISKKDAELFQKEASVDGIPNLDELRNRSIVIQEVIIRNLEEEFVDNGKLSKNPGLIAFYPGDSETSKGRAQLMETDVWRLRHSRQGTRAEKKWTATPFKVSGKHRGDLPLLKTAYDSEEQPVRLVHSTPLLATGVTLPGISVVIDDCTQKIPGSYQHNGVIKLEVHFEDRSMMMQKRGRCGRTDHGTYFPLVSEERLKMIKDSDHTYTVLDRSFQTNDMPYVYDHQSELMKLPSTETAFELQEDMLNTGFINKSVVYDAPTLYARTLSNNFHCMPLVIGDFLLRCCHFGVAWHGIILSGCILSEFRFIRKASGGGIGRNSSQLPVNLWMSRTDASHDSDMELATEMAVNLLLACGVGEKLKKETKKPPIPYIIQPMDFGSVDGIQDLLRAVTRVYHCMSNMGLCNATLNLPLALLCDVADVCSLKKKAFIRRNGEQKTYSVYRLLPKHGINFQACILQSFGSRVALGVTAKEEKQEDVRRLYKVGGKVDCTTRLVQGEVARQSSCKMAVYYDVMHRNVNDKYLTGYLHYTTAAQFVVFGNVVGSSNDEVDKDRFVLKITTNTAPIFFKFRSLKTMMSVVRMRSILRWSPILSFVTNFNHERYCTTMRDIVSFINKTQSWAYDVNADFSKGSNERETACGEFRKVSEDGYCIVEKDGSILYDTRVSAPNNAQQAATTSASQLSTVSTCSTANSSSLKGAESSTSTTRSTPSMESLARQSSSDDSMIGARPSQYRLMPKISAPKSDEKTALHFPNSDSAIVTCDTQSSSSLTSYEAVLAGEKTPLCLEQVNFICGFMKKKDDEKEDADNNGDEEDEKDRKKKETD